MINKSFLSNLSLEPLPFRYDYNQLPKFLELK